MTHRTPRPRAVWLLAAGLALPLALLAPRWAQAADAAAPKAPPRIAWVDAQNVLDDSALGKDIKSRLKAYSESREKVMSLEKEDLQKLQDKIEQQGALLSDDARRQKILELNEKGTAYQNKLIQYQKELRDKTDELLGEFNDALIKAVTKIAAREGYQYVLDHGGEGSVLYGAPEFDLTRMVKAELDARTE